MQTTLDQFAAGAATRLGAGTLCSLMLRRGPLLAQVASNDSRAAACDQTEVREGSGPCITAMDQLTSVVVDDLVGDERWPRWNEAARSYGFRSFIALPGYVDEDTTVALNAYSLSAHAWHRENIIAIDLYVQEIATALRWRM